jgi:hypothetical protein
VNGQQIPRLEPGERRHLEPLDRLIWSDMVLGGSEAGATQKEHNQNGQFAICNSQFAI